MSLVTCNETKVHGRAAAVEPREQPHHARAARRALPRPRHAARARGGARGGHAAQEAESAAAPLRGQDRLPQVHQDGAGGGTLRWMSSTWFKLTFPVPR